MNAGLNSLNSRTRGHERHCGPVQSLTPSFVRILKPPQRTWSYHDSEVRLLFTVSQTFTIQGRGVSLLPELRPVGEERFKMGDPLRLKRPDGTGELTKIGGIELATVLNAPCKVLVLLSSKSREDVPIGTEVWSVDPCG